MAKLTLSDLDVRGRRVLVRVDFNVPLSDDARTVADDTRIRAALPTVRAIVGSGGRAVLMSHLGRPQGRPSPRHSLAPVADRLRQLSGLPVAFARDTVGPDALLTVESAADGSIVLLENTRFAAGETTNDPEFAARLAALGDVFVNDAFGTAHRAHASNVGVASQMAQAAAGLLLQSEIRWLEGALASPERPFVALLGGAKVSDKIGVIAHLLPRVDALLIGGAMSYTFLKALGQAVGSSLVEKDRIKEARAIWKRAGGKIHLPSDHVVAPDFSSRAPTSTAAGGIPDAMMGLDIGPATCAAYAHRILEARTVVWNGPMGVFEIPAFAAGTRLMAEALAAATKSGALTIVGGGDSVAAVTGGGFAGDITHVSTGGGAMLALLEGRTLPGLEALTDRD